jgi:hypothetical protein
MPIVDAFRAQVGFVLLTVTRVVLPLRTSVERLYSSHPAIYPTMASKPLDSAEWLRLVEQRLPVVCNDPEALRSFFPGDADTLLALGCGSGINVPVFEADVLCGSVNAFHQTGWYTPGHVALAQRLAPDFFRSLA